MKSLLIATVKVHGRSGICCESEDCLFKKACANHATAGDFRSEGGFSPELNAGLDDTGNYAIHCITTMKNPLFEEFETVPINFDKLNRGSVFIEDGRFKNSEEDARRWEEGYEDERRYGRYENYDDDDYWGGYTPVRGN